MSLDGSLSLTRTRRVRCQPSIPAPALAMRRVTQNVMRDQLPGDEHEPRHLRLPAVLHHGLGHLPLPLPNQCPTAIRQRQSRPATRASSPGAGTSRSLGHRRCAELHRHGNQRRLSGAASPPALRARPHPLSSSRPPTRSRVCRTTGSRTSRRQRPSTSCRRIRNVRNSI